MKNDIFEAAKEADFSLFHLAINGDDGSGYAERLQSAIDILEPYTNEELLDAARAFPMSGARRYIKSFVNNRMEK